MNIGRFGVPHTSHSSCGIRSESDFPQSLH